MIENLRYRPTAFDMIDEEQFEYLEARIARMEQKISILWRALEVLCNDPSLSDKTREMLSDRVQELLH
jgi:hypothetical protein